MRFFEDIKYIVGQGNRVFWGLISCLKSQKNNTIVFESFLGKQYSCNPRAIYEYLLNKTDDIQFVWAFNDLKKFTSLSKNKNTVLVKRRSLAYYKFVVSSKIFISNWKITADTPVVKNQFRLQTWHGGGCYKTVGNKIKYSDNFRKKVTSNDINHFNCFVSSSEYFSNEVIRNQFEYTGKIIESGMPRNDILVNEENENQILKIKDELNIAKDVYIVLYAPTYRDDSCKFTSIDYGKIKNSVKMRFNKDAIILYRGHHMESNSISADVINVTNYYDMQNLLLISDMLITDYSSSIWDFSFTYKPCFLYTPDLKEYIRNRGINEDIHSWGFPVCESNETLEKEILNFDAEIHKKRMKEHHDKLNSFENGHATEKVCKLILEELNKE